jgi:hypothetical protein
MNSTDESLADALARALFDEFADKIGSSGTAYFPLRGDPHAETYFEAPTLAFMGREDFALPGNGTPEGLIDALAARWRSEGEDRLAGIAPRLKLIAQALGDEAAAGDGEVDILCYTMF